MTPLEALKALMEKTVVTSAKEQKERDELYKIVLDAIINQ